MCDSRPADNHTFFFQSESTYVRHLKEEHNCTPEDLEEAEVRQCDV